MNELLYKKSKAVGSLNRVEGFEPLELARTISQEGQPDQLYLDVKYRKLWFRLVYPTGRIESHIVHFNENMALADSGQTIRSLGINSLRWRKRLP